MLRLISSILVALSLTAVAGDAAAIIGMPLTPMSYAGVARRTTRRAVYGGAAYGAYGGYGYGTGAYMTALPPGCVSTVMNGVAVQQCGGAYYQPYYQGSSVVYQPYAPY